MAKIANVRILLLCAAAVLSHCKARKSSNLSALGDPSAGHYLDLARIDSPALLKQLCLRRDLYIFVGNGEKFGQIVPRPGLSKEETDYLGLLVGYEKKKEQWYFGKITQEYESLKKALASVDASCLKAGYVDSRIALIGILDGPEIGDSRLEISRFDSYQDKVQSQTLVLQWDPGSSKIIKRAKNFELLMSRDVELILKDFDQDLAVKKLLFGDDGSFEMVVPIFKGHSVEVRPTSAILNFEDALKVGASGRRISSLNNLTFQHTSLLDFQDAQGALPLDQTKAYSLVWSPNVVCGALGNAELEQCKQNMSAHLRSGFQPKDMQGCKSNFIRRLSNRSAGQGDTDQGDTDQGDTDQGDTDQGDTDQGDTDQGDTDQGDTDQGGKGFAIATSDISPSSYLTESSGKHSAPVAIRAFGGATAIDAKPKSSVGQLRIPVHAVTELMLLDTCSMDLRSWSKANWLLPSDGSRAPTILAGVALANPMPLSADAVDYSLLNSNQYAYLFLSTLHVLSQHRNEIDDKLFRSNDPEDFAAKQRMMNSMLNRSSETSSDTIISLRTLLRNIGSSPKDQAREQGLMSQLFSEDLIDRTCNLQTKLYHCSGSTCPVDASYPSDDVIDAAILRRNNHIFSEKLAAIEAILSKGIVPDAGVRSALENARRQSSQDQFPWNIDPINPGLVEWLTIQHDLPYFWAFGRPETVLADKIKVEQKFFHELRQFHRFYSMGDLKVKPDPFEFLASSYKIRLLPYFDDYHAEKSTQSFSRFLAQRKELLDLTAAFYDLYAKKGIKNLPDRATFLKNAKDRTDRWAEIVNAGGKSGEEIMRDVLRN